MDARTAINRYCQYQERCHAEVRNKLYDLGCRTTEVEEHISDLIEKGILNEERYAKAYARGKFRMKQWGRIKIIQQLRLKKVTDYCIKKGLSEIDADEYTGVLKKLVERKWSELAGEKNPGVRKMKVFRYVAQKGYESDMINDTINEIIKPGK
jgi:regulatory protein